MDKRDEETRDISPDNSTSSFHRPGILHKGPDYASRYPRGQAELFLYECEMIEDIEVALHADVMASWQTDLAAVITWSC